MHRGPHEHTIHLPYSQRPQQFQNYENQSDYESRSYKSTKNNKDKNLWPLTTGRGQMDDGISVHSNERVILHLPDYPDRQRNQNIQRPKNEKQFRHVAVQMTTKYVLDQPPRKDVTDASTQTVSVTPPSPDVVKPIAIPFQPRIATPPTPIIEILEEDEAPIALPALPKKSITPLLFYVGENGLHVKGKKSKDKQAVYPIRIIQVDRKQVHDRYLEIKKFNAYDKSSKKPLHVNFKDIYKERQKYGLDNSF